MDDPKSSEQPEASTERQPEADPVKQWIVVRTDLKMRRGKEDAQSGHAAMAWLSLRLRAAIEDGDGNVFRSVREQIADPEMQAETVGFSIRQFVLTVEEFDWLDASFTKVVLSVDSEEELVAVHDAVLAAGLESHLIKDSGLTEFSGVPTLTCIGIGPHRASRVVSLLSHLKLR